MSNYRESEYVEFDPVAWSRKTTSILWRRRKAMLGFFAVAMALIVLGLIVCPRTYRSDAKLFVHVGRESLSLDPTATTGQTLQLHQTRESEIASVMDLLKTRGLYEQVVDRIGVNVILGDQEYDGTDTTAQQNVSPEKRAKAIKSLMGDIGQDREDESSVITLDCSADSPQLAQAILTEYIREFRQHHFAAHRTDGSNNFFEEQVETIRAQYEKTSEKLRAIREELGSVSVYTRRDAIQRQIDILEQERLTAVTSLQASEAMQQSLGTALTKLPEQRIAESVTGLPDDAVGSMRKEASMLLVQEGALLARYTQYHPAVIAVRTRRLEAERILRDIIEQPSQVTNAVNPAWHDMHVKLLYEQSNAASLQARIEAIDNSLNQIQTQLVMLNEREAEMIALEQSVELLRQKLGNYAERIEETRIEEAMAISGISNVNLVQPPSLIFKAASPRKGIVLVIGFFFAVLGALTFGFVREMFDDESTPDRASAEQADHSHRSPYAPGDPERTLDQSSTMLQHGY